ncbi:hypothetical protein [Sutcliffiella cohnii]|uniref:hypothetical protein n=1 Tax=Sutcliffiella cohnii TaxID=33932 RepID=UPI002E1F39ED|nr:hypothetical protein [Sutcliffiella cohnii]
MRPLYVIIVFLICIGCSNEPNRYIDTEGTNLPNMTGPNSDTISFGIFTTKGDILDTYIDEGEKELVLEFDQYFKNDITFGVIVLKDFMQSSIKFEKEKGNYFEFEALSNSSNQFKLQLDSIKDAQELDILIVPLPNEYPETSNIEEAFDIGENMTLRRRINKSNASVVYSNIDAEALNESIIDSIYLSKEKSNYDYVHTVKEGETVYIHVGNHTNSPLTYAVIGFLGWEQVKIDDKDVVFTTVQPDTTNVIEFEVPAAEDQTPLQFFAFPHPLNVNEVDYDSKNTYSTLRAFIKK